jgi:chemotaxis regulatin CheY-phosphate phosphatase CheZ
MNKNLPVISLELNSGVFKIRTPEAIYEITVHPESSLARAVEKVVQKESSEPPTEVDIPVPFEGAEEPFYRELSEELYKEVGKLARQLSLSIKDIPTELPPHRVDLQKTGIELEDAKGQLADIVQMTEKATMDIMDLAETIQEDLESVESQLMSIRDLEFMNRDEAMESDDDFGDGDLPSDESPLEDFVSFLTDLIERGGSLQEAVRQLPVVDNSAPATRTPEPAPTPEPPAPEPAAPETKAVKSYVFDLDVVFQTLYELCTNETVKDHIKAMRAEQTTAFDTSAVAQALNDLAATAEVEDTFYNLPISSILKSLFQACSNDKYKQILKKMNQTAGNIFLDAVLPVEGEMKEEEVVVESAPEPEAAEPAASEPEAAAPSESSEGSGLSPEQVSTIVTQLEELVGLAQTEKERLEGLDPGAFVPADASQVRNEDRAKIITSVEGSSEGVQRILGHITSILETLSFQDLSGQRILKIVHLISEIQVQLLSLLVSFGAKMKQRQDEWAAQSREESEQMAQTEVDKMLEKVTGPSTLEGPEAEGRLDQDAVNDLLADLGF